jgi:hypothetical protein
MPGAAALGIDRVLDGTWWFGVSLRRAGALGLKVTFD